MKGQKLPKLDNLFSERSLKLARGRFVHLVDA